MPARLDGAIRFHTGISVINTAVDNLDLTNPVVDPPYSPGGGNMLSTIFASAASTITGMVPVDSGRLLGVDSALGGGGIGFAGESGSSTAGNRVATGMVFSTGPTVLHRPAGILWYDPVSLRWRRIGGPS